MAWVMMTPVSVQLGTGETTIKTAGAAEQLRIDSIVICNTDSSARTFRLYFYDSGSDTAAADVALYYDVTIPANTTWVYPVGVLNFDNDYRLSGSSDVAAKITVTISGWSES